MTESEIAAEFDRHHANLGHMWGYDTAKGRDQSAEAQIARCHAITGHGPAVLNRICDRALRQSVTIVPNRIAELERQVADLEARNRSMGELLLQQHTRFEAMVQSRNAALLRMEAAIATSHGLIDAEVQRRIAEATACDDNSTPENPRPDGSYGTPQHDPEAPGKPPPPRAFPSRALRHQHQSGGLLSTADAGRVRLGGYAPSLPPR